jgi:hypothetical protein
MSNDVDRVGQGNDRVADQLPRTVPGDAPTAINVDHRGAVEGTIPELGATSGRIDRVVFEQENRRVTASRNRLVDLTLQGPRGLVVDASP